MPKGIPKNGLWRGLEPLDEWVRRMQADAPLCACGCGQRIQVQRHHRRYGIPTYVRGHHSRVKHGRYVGVDQWVNENQGQHACACGCGGLIRIVARHHATGIPRYLPAHHTPPKLGHGPAHPRFIADRSKVKARNGRAFTPWVMKQIRERDGGRCVRCRAVEGLEHDHIVPVSLRGSGTLENGQLLCRRCHRLKTTIDILRVRIIRLIFKALRKVLAFVETLHTQETHHGCYRQPPVVPQALQVHS